MKYRSRPQTVEAAQCDKVGTILAFLGGHTLDALCVTGDWVVRHEDGSFDVLSPEQFAARYVAIEGVPSLRSPESVA